MSVSIRHTKHSLSRDKKASVSLPSLLPFFLYMTLPSLGLTQSDLLYCVLTVQATTHSCSCTAQPTQFLQAVWKT